MLSTAKPRPVSLISVSFGQTVFAAELIQRQHAPRSLRLIAAAPFGPHNA
jgi:hypothetical protein